MFTVESSSPGETSRLAERMAAACRPGTVLALVGDLGAGKTLFVQGLARGLGFRGEVTSPTFNLMNYYEGKLPITHFDLYRLGRAEELYDIGFYEYAEDDRGVVLIEWPDRFPEEMPEDYVRLAIERADAAGEDLREEQRRLLRFSLVGEGLRDVYEEMKNVVDSGD